MPDQLIPKNWDQRTWFGKLYYPFEVLMAYTAIALIVLLSLPSAATEWLRDRWPSIYKDDLEHGSDAFDPETSDEVTGFTADTDDEWSFDATDDDSGIGMADDETFESAASDRLVVPIEGTEYEFPIEHVPALKERFERLEIVEAGESGELE